MLPAGPAMAQPAATPLGAGATWVLALLVLLALGLAVAGWMQARRLRARLAAALGHRAAEAAALAALREELRIPVGELAMLAEILQADRPTPDAGPRAEAVGQSALRLAGLLDDLGELTGPAQPVADAPFDPEAALAHAMDAASGPAARRGVTLACTMAGDVPALLAGDGARFGRALERMLDHALARVERGPIRLDLSAEPSRREGKTRLVGVVSCEGPLNGAWEEGFALAMARRLAGMAGAVLLSETDGGGGRRLVLDAVLPVLAPRSPPAALAGRRVLLVEAAALQRAVLLDQLASLGLHPEGAASFHEALRRLARGTAPPDAVIIAARVGAESGAEVAERLRARLGPGVPLIALAPGMEGAPEGMFAAGVGQPVLPMRLAAALGAALAPPGAVPASAPTAASLLRPPRVLLAEPDAMTQFLLRHILESAGALVDVAGHGEAVLACARAASYDLILMDLQLPRLDGLATARAIRADGGPNASTAIIGLTAGSGAEVERRCREAGMSGCLGKPLDQQRLVATLGLPRQGAPMRAGGSG